MSGPQVKALLDKGKFANYQNYILIGPGLYECVVTGDEAP